MWAQAPPWGRWWQQDSLRSSPFHVDGTSSTCASEARVPDHHHRRRNTTPNTKTTPTAKAKTKTAPKTATTALKSLKTLFVSCLALALLSFGPLASAQNSESIDWGDVCTSDELASYVDTLCGATFFVSTLAFDPLEPNTLSNMTLILRPSKIIPEDDWLARTQYIDLYLPGFTPQGTQHPSIATYRNLPLTPMNPTASNYNTEVYPLFTPNAIYMTTSGILRLTFIGGEQMRTDVDTEVKICCIMLPNESPENDESLTIAAPTNEGSSAISIQSEAIKSSPYIDPGSQFSFLQVMFDPAVSQQMCTVELSVKTANDLEDNQQIILYLPELTYVDNEDATIEFSTAESDNPLDWMLFKSEAEWNNTEKSLHFYLRDGQVLAAGRQITLKTLEGAFQLPLAVEQNSDQILVEARSQDDIDEIIAKTTVSQSSVVPPVRSFPFSELLYVNAVPYGQGDVTFRFRTNRPMFVNQSIFLRLSGFQSDVVDVVLLGDAKTHFLNSMGRWSMPENRMNLTIADTLYSNEVITEITFYNMILPPALYESDESLLVWTSDEDAPQESIQTSPEICDEVCGGDQKTFARSQISFYPEEPRLAANITFTILPTINFFEGDQIILHLYGFVCSNSLISLNGTGAFKIADEKADWNADEYQLILTVGENQLINHTDPLIIIILDDQNFRLPGLLSENDGTLRIEGVGALIYEEPLKKVPALGDTKEILSSRVDIEPYWASSATTPFARIIVSFILNADVLPNSDITVKLGGVLHNPPAAQSYAIGFSTSRTGTVDLSGKNAPLFYNQGKWDHDTSTLTLRTKPEYIYAGEYIRFFLERDMYFQLPPAAYQNDPGFTISVSGAGIAEQQFLYSTKWVDNNKSWVETEISYGSSGSVWYPGESPDFYLYFQPNVDLYPGSVIALKLPGFTHSSTTVHISAPETAVANEYDISGYIDTGIWDPEAETLSLTVPVGSAIVRRLNVMRIPASGNYGFMLPVTALERNDPRLTISVTGSCFLYEEQIQTSPRIVARTFLTSIFQYYPATKESIFLFIMYLKPSVNISYPAHIQIYLPGFRNSLSKTTIEITGPSRGYINDAEATWNETTETLVMPTIYNGDVIVMDTMLEFHIEESQGFILPSTLNKDDETLQIRSVNNIGWESIKTSPKVGDQPYSPHRFCMVQYEDAVRTSAPICADATDCDPPLTDPCNAAELSRCGCTSTLTSAVNISIFGFNLEESDTLFFLPYDELCSLDPGPLYLEAFSLQEGNPEIVDDGGEAIFSGFRATLPGYYRMCYTHSSTMYDIGFVKVKPACDAPYVSVGGVCAERCPNSQKPVAGNCVLDPNAMDDSDGQALMLQVEMGDAEVTGSTHLAERDSTDQELRYYIYRYTYELATLLNCEPSRIQVASISEGSTLVNTVFTPVTDTSSTERSPAALISLLRALQSDTSSSFYSNTFFQDIAKPRNLSQVVSNEYDPASLAVRECTDGVYRTFCPYAGDVMALGASYTIFGVGVICIPVALALLCCICWRLDFQLSSPIDEETMTALRTEPQKVDKYLQIEYAKSWLDGRFAGEQWQQSRDIPILHITAS